MPALIFPKTSFKRESYQNKTKYKLLILTFLKAASSLFDFFEILKYSATKLTEPKLLIYRHKMQIIVKLPDSTNEKHEWAVIEMQGELESRLGSDQNLTGKFIGDLVSPSIFSL